MNRQRFDATDLGVRLNETLRTTDVDCGFCIPEIRVARLLLVLNELETRMAGLQDLPDPDLTELVSSAIMACGFTDPAEIRYAVAEVLEAIEVPGCSSGRILVRRCFLESSLPGAGFNFEGAALGAAVSDCFRLPVV